MLTRPNKTLCMVVVYPNSEKHHSDYFNSLSTQTENFFDLLILCDGITVNNINFNKGELLLKDIPKGKTPAQIRDIGIKFAVNNNYKYLIFSDIDDFFTDNRIEASIDMLISYDFVFNDIVPVDSDGRVLKSYKTSFEFPDCLYKAHSLLDFNIVGLGSAAVNVGKIPKIDIPTDLIAIDWWFFTVLLLQGLNGKFLNKIKTFYRQGNNNLVGGFQKLSTKRLDSGIKVKHLHYYRLTEYCLDYGNNEFAEIFSKKNYEIKLLKQAIEDEEFKKKYIISINNRLPEIYKGWWSEILPLSKWSDYDNI